MSFEDLWGDLFGNNRTADAVESFADFGASELQSIFDHVVGDDLRMPNGPGNAEDASSNQFLILVANDGIVTFEGDDGEGVIAGIDTMFALVFPALDLSYSNIILVCTFVCTCQGKALIHFLFLQNSADFPFLIDKLDSCFLQS